MNNMTYQPNAKGKFRVNHNGLISIAVQTDDKDIYLVRNYTNRNTEGIPVLSNEFTFLTNYKPHEN
jgi:hypothetical protein